MFQYWSWSLLDRRLTSAAGSQETARSKIWSKLVSICPFHHHKEELKDMEIQKSNVSYKFCINKFYTSFFCKKLILLIKNNFFISFFLGTVHLFIKIYIYIKTVYLKLIQIISQYKISYYSID